MLFLLREYLNKTIINIRSNNNINNCAHHSKQRNALTYSHDNKIQPTSKVKATSTLNYECKRKTNNVCHPHSNAYRKTTASFQNHSKPQGLRYINFIFFPLYVNNNNMGESRTQRILKKLVH